MKASEFFADRLGRILVQLFCGAAALCFLRATGTEGDVLLLLAAVLLVLFALVQGVEYLRCRARLMELENIWAGLEEKYLFAECIPKPQDSYERQLFDLNRRAGKAMLTAVSQAQSAQRAYREYIESWVHEVKTPITAARLLCRNLDGESRRKLEQELAQIEAHVERALYYARAESPQRDCVIRQVSLEEIVSQAVQTHRTLLIQSGVGVETAGLKGSVYTDEKWAVFLLGQLLQNAARYRGEHPHIRITGKPLGKQTQLTVADNGIGIPAHELPRVFDRGFTGSNGRTRGGSTGMGLYLCRKLADFLEMDIRLTSQEGEGTQVTLTFPSPENLSKL